MTAHALPGGRATHIPRPEMRLAGWVSVVFLALLGLGAVAGGIALVVRPDGSVMGFDVAILAGSPFRDFLVPGLILGGLFGLGSLAVAVIGLRRWHVAPFLAFGIGIGQMIWIPVQLSIIKDLSFFHPTCYAIGLVIATASYWWGRETFRAWLAGR
jgi:hypothetical protein